MFQHDVRVWRQDSLSPSPEPSFHPSAASRLGEVLIVDEDAALSRNIVEFLSRRNCLARAISKISDALDSVRRGIWGLVLLDIAPSKGVGLDYLRAIRSISDVPLLVTGKSTTPADRTLALELGADGHIDKPFDLHELWAQARAIERRQELGRFRPSVSRQRGGYRFNGWTLNLIDRSLIDPAGSPVPLSRSAYALLLAFLDAPGRPLSRDTLLQTVYAHEDVSDRSIDVRVMRLRRIFEQESTARKSLIRTEHGVGYVFDAMVERLH